MLPPEGAARTSVLRDQTAAAAIMTITDEEVLRSSIRGKADALKGLHACILVNGSVVQLAGVSEEEARAWMKQRRLLVPVYGNMSNRPNYVQEKVLDRLLYQRADKQTFKDAEKRLKRIVENHVARS